MIIIWLIGILIFASPTIALFVKLPLGQEFSELYMLGFNHKFDDIPFNIEVGTTYSVYIGIVNNLQLSAYYSCFVKLVNASMAFTTSSSETPISQSSLYQFNILIPSEGSWEAPLTIQVNKLAFNNGFAHISELTLNGVTIPFNESTEWDSTKMGYYFNLFVELWIFNSTYQGWQYNQRFVNLVLNMTA